MGDDLFFKAFSFFLAMVMLLAVVVLSYLVVSLITGHPLDPPPTVSICTGKGCR